MSVGREVAPPTPVAEGQQLASAAPPAAQLAHGVEDGRIGDGDQALLARLGRVVEHDLVARHVDVLLLDRGQPVAAVVLGVLLAADAEEAEVEQAEGRARAPAPAACRAGRGGWRRPCGPCGSRRATTSTRSCLALSRCSRHAGWYRYWRRPASSVPTAWMWPLGAGQIQTCVHAGGITSALQRATSSAPSAPSVLVEVDEPLALAPARPAGRVGVDAAQAGHGIAVATRAAPGQRRRSRGGQRKFSKYRLGVGPRWPWYLEPAAPLP